MVVGAPLEGSHHGYAGFGNQVGVPLEGSPLGFYPLSKVRPSQKVRSPLRSRQSRGWAAHHGYVGFGNQAGEGVGSPGEGSLFYV